MHRILSAFVVLSLAFLVGGSCSKRAERQAPWKLSKAERAGGWTILFDGVNTDAWRGYRKDAFPAKGWVVENGCLKVVGGGGGGDLVTREQYADFELELEWKTSPKANSGIMYRVTEKHGAPWQTGPEYQVLDDHGLGLAADDLHASGSLYDMVRADRRKVMQPGRFNESRIRVKDGLVEHWLNDLRVASFRIDDARWSELIAASKFKAYEGFGVQPKGHVALQDHGNDVWFRKIKIRRLDAPLPDEVPLFDGSSLKGWTSHLAGGAPLARTWSIDGEVLRCTGTPNGYLRTKASYESFVLMLEWRYAPEKRLAGNSGVLFRLKGEDKIWPRCLEAQLMSGFAGDFWNLGDPKFRSDPMRSRGRNTPRTHFAENPLGEWNHYEIIVDGPKITLKVNGEVVNHGWDASVFAGPIALQSEGVPIDFRRVRLSPIH